jgi:hypothetical protein
VRVLRLVKSDRGNGTEGSAPSAAYSYQISAS